MYSWCAPIDLALLKFKNPPSSYGTPAILGDSGLLKPGDDLMAVGSLLGNRFTATYGNLANKAVPKMYPFLTSYLSTHFEFSPSVEMTYTGRIDHGCSGGPLFAKDGSVVGMILSVVHELDSMPRALASENIATICERMDKPGELELGTIEAAFTDSAKLIAPDIEVLKIPAPKNPGVVVVLVYKNGSSDGILQKGDIISHYNGVPVKSARDLSRMILHTGSTGMKVSLGVVRGDGPPTMIEIVMAKLE